MGSFVGHPSMITPWAHLQKMGQIGSEEDRRRWREEDQIRHDLAYGKPALIPSGLKGPPPEKADE